MGNDLIVALAGDVIERESCECFYGAIVAIGLTKSKTFEFGEILEPANPQGTNRFVARVRNRMCGLIVVSIENQVRFHAILFEEADAPHGVSVQQLLVCRHDLGSDAVVTGGDGPHAMFHLMPPR